MTAEDTKFYYIGVDVGTGSARAALVDDDGNILAESTHATQTYRVEADARIFEQSTTDIWAQIKLAITQVVAASKVDPARIKGLGFDATCSLAVTDFNGRPIAVTPQQPSSSEWGPDERNVILWADHRAEDEAALINATGSKVLNYVGKTMSLEMEIPKILWLKKHMPAELFKQCMFFDLPDYLTYRATGSLARSNCSLVCKCSYIPPGVDGSELGWQPDFFEQIGLGELVKDDFKQLGGVPGRNGMVLTAGQPVGQGLTAEVAAELGLQPGTAVGSALIDAYAGWVGTVAAPATNAVDEASNRPSLISSQNRLAAIAGTSTCYCVQSPDGILVDGVWGPYKHAVFPGLWMNEGGQSSTGQLIDFIIDTHPASPQLRTLASETNRSPFTVLHDKIDELVAAAGLPNASWLTKDVFVYPDFHGNRSPLADPQMRGMITGLKLDRSLTDLAVRYYATLEAIALQTRHIVSEMNAKGHKIDAIYMSGGHVKNAVFMQLIADVCGMPVQLPFSSSASVVAGSAILGRFAAEVQDPKTTNASGTYAPKVATTITDQKSAETASYEHKDHLWDLMVRMTKPGTLVFPHKDAKLSALLDVKYQIFQECIATQRRWKSMVAEVLT
ncbi:ribulose kinase and related carbohydrate kinases [Moesziomyces antarcticus T-34]|uniref:Ribulose kinase and related carbohydrate kinases n=1 Tax=Pseudozyma antarctica (strain T-34) TaxID=1151754 RepID=M9MG79_PSEA3|nr:ribulose kinase and related carbohydrate kinases [Moesziomyces antarcticus T-34]